MKIGGGYYMYVHILWYGVCGGALHVVHRDDCSHVYCEHGKGTTGDIWICPRELCNECDILKEAREDWDNWLEEFLREPKWEW